ncbi:MAG: undecaprenyl/decaprenyl-phosphate alpha-N-acetylglucosaminyl 1-phosphate transferase [Anaerolineae bacterium]|nr:undecaprenyl/decaprenyl-phosphate alpha-N-acetylglucosaminyl 1-phosphate transferase [Anaerolineae bacterium]
MPFSTMAAVVFAVAVAVAAVLTPLAQRLGLRYGISDVPGGRRKHSGVIPRLGGIPLYAAFCTAVLLTRTFPRSDPEEWLRVTGILVGATTVFLGGLLDDKKQMKALTQVAGMAIVALMAIPFKVFIEVINNPVTDQQIWFPWYVMLPLTLLWLMGSMVTMNLLDGLDGLSTGVTTVASLILFVHMLRLEQYSTSLLPLALLGATLGFLPYNFHPAKIFLGSSGAYFLGYTVGALSIVSGAKMATLLLVMGIPILDVAWQLFDRWRREQPLGIGDRGHLHFRLYDLGLPHRSIVLLYYLLTTILGGLALMISSRLLKLLAILTLAAVMALTLATLSRKDPTTEKHPRS